MIASLAFMLLLDGTLTDFCGPAPAICSECRIFAECRTSDNSSVIPQNLPASLQGMTIQYDGTERVALSSEMFERYSALRSIKLQGIGISVLRNKVFQKLVHLKVLEISQTSIQTIPNSILPIKSEIDTLHLHSNRLTEIPYHLFKDLPELSELDIGYNNISTSNCSTIGQPFYELKGLQRLVLSKIAVPKHCQSEVPDDFFKPIQSNVKELNLEAANIYEGSQKIFSSFSMLKKLDISLAESFLNCPSKAATLFSYLPFSIKTLVTRRWSTYLYMKPECSITGAALAGLKRLPNLAQLDMQYSDLMFGKDLKKSVFSGFHHLVNLNIGYARFTQIEKYAFGECSNLKSITLSGNPLGSLPFKLFPNRNFSQVEEIKLKRTNIYSGKGLS